MGIWAGDGTLLSSLFLFIKKAYFFSEIWKNQLLKFFSCLLWNKFWRVNPLYSEGFREELSTFFSRVASVNREQCHVILEFDFLSFSLFLPLKEQTETACLYHMNDTRQTQVTKGFRVSSYSGLVWKIRGMVWLTGLLSNTSEMKRCRAICFLNTVLRLPMQRR